jgi:transposase
LCELRGKLAAPRTRFRQRQAVEQKVERLLAEHEAAKWMTVKIELQEEAEYRQAKSGRPNPKTQYVKKTRDRYGLAWELNQEALSQAERDDGVFPLLTNDRTLNAEEVLRAYKRQPLIEKRFSQFKTDFAVAPIYLQDVGRITGLLAVYFFALVVQTLLERELRAAMKATGIKSLPLYPEDRPCTRPTTHRLIELFEPIQRHELYVDDGEPQIMVTELTPVQRQVIELLGLSPDEYGR